MFTIVFDHVMVIICSIVHVLVVGSVKVKEVEVGKLKEEAVQKEAPAKWRSKRPSHTVKDVLMLKSLFNIFSS